MLSDDDSATVCYICEKAELNAARIIDCCYCSKSVHFRCKKIFGNAVSKTKKNPFFCSAECAETSSKINGMQAENDVVISELRSLNQSMRDMKQESTQVRHAVDQTRNQLAALIETTKHIESSQEFLANQFDSLQAEFIIFKDELNSLKAENVKMHRVVGGIQENQNNLSATVERLELELDKMHRAALSKNAVILGLPVIVDENIVDVVCKIGTAVGCHLESNSIASARRIPLKSGSGLLPPILVSFFDEIVKEDFFGKKRLHGTLLASAVGNEFSGSTKKITVRDELTTFGRELLREAKEVQTALDIKYVWPGRNGKILLKRCDGGKVEEIGSKQQLSAFARSMSKRSLNASVMSTGSPSSVTAPSPKRHQTGRNQ